MTIGRRLARRLSHEGRYDPSAKNYYRSLLSQRESHRFIQQHGTTTTTHAPNQTGPPVLDDAWAYFEHQILPRCTKKREGDGATFEGGGKYDRAEPGEFTESTQLYPIWDTPMEDMADFGVGVGLYFGTIRYFAIAAFIAGLINIPNMLYFGSDVYTGGRGQERVLSRLFLKGSAVCTNVSWEPCPTCHVEDSDEYRLGRGRSEEGAELLFIKKNNCSVHDIFGAMSFVTLLLMVLTIYYFFFSQRKRAKAFDDAEERSSDYSIIVKNPPPDARDPETWKHFFETKFDDVHVTACTIVKDNNNLVNALLRRHQLLLDLQNLLPVGELLHARRLNQSVTLCHDPPWWKTWLCLALDSRDIYARIVRENYTIEKLLGREYNVTNVFVTFETERAARKVLKAMTFPILRREKNGEFRYNGTVLRVKQADEPSSIRWGHIGRSPFVQFLQRLLTTIITIGLISAGGFVTYLANKRGALNASIVITLLSLITPFVMSIVTSFESHSSESSYSASNYLKVTTFRWFNTAIITHIITPFVETLQDGNFLIDSIYVLFMVDLLSKPLLQLSDLFGNLNRHYFGPREPDQRRMNLKFQGAAYDIGERYTEMTRVLFLTVFYSQVFPAAFFFAAAILTESYWLDKFSILRSWKQGPNIGTKISIFSNFFFLAILLVYSVVMSYTYAQMPFDNACSTNTTITSNYIGNFTVNEVDIVNITATSEHKFHKFCNQNFLESIPATFPPLPSFQPEGSEWMNESQRLFATIYGWSCVVVCVFVGATMVLETLYFFFSSLFFNGYKPLGEPRQKRFSTVPGLFGYIPQIQVPGYNFPLILCDLQNVGSDLVGWKDIHVTHGSHNIINGLFTTKAQAFSIAKSWTPNYDS